MDRVDALAKKIWNYHLLHHKIEKADLIVVLGSRDIRVAERAAELYLQGYAPLIVFSGGHGPITKKLWADSTEAEVFTEVAVKSGVPREHIIIENRSINTGENIQFTKQLLKEKGIQPKKVIIVQKPYMERRAYAAVRKQWPEIEIKVTSPQISYEDYPNEAITKERVIHAIVADLQRIEEYPKLGFQIAQEVPKDVHEAYEELVELGFTDLLTKS